MAQVDRLDRERVTYVGTEESAVGTRASSMLRVHLVQGQGDIGAALTVDMVPINDDRVIRFDNPQHLHGLKGGAWGAPQFLLKGVKSADRLGAGDTAVELSQHVLLAHGIGRKVAGIGCTIGTGSTRTELVVDAHTDLLVGEIIFVEISAGVYEAATISAFADATHITLREGLTTAPTNGLAVRGSYNFVPAETRTSTLSVEQKLTAGSGYEWRVLGAFGSLAFAFPDAFGKEIPVTLTGVGCHTWQGPTTLTSPSFGTSTPADDDMGSPFLWKPKLYLDTTITRQTDSPYRVEKCAFEFMSAPDPIPDGTADTGVKGFLDTAGRDGGVFARVTLTIRADTGEDTIFDADTIRSGLMTVDNADGSILALAFGRASLAAKPQKVTLGSGRTGYTLVLNLLRDTLSAVGSGADELDLARAPFRLAVG